MLTGVEAETAGHCAAGLSVCAERAACAGAGEKRAEPAAAAGPATSPSPRGEPTEEATGE